MKLKQYDLEDLTTTKGAGYEIIELKDIIEAETEPILPKEERFKLLSELHKKIKKLVCKGLNRLLT